MKPTNILLLDLNPACELTGALRGIIESDNQSEIRLQQASVPTEDQVGYAERGWPELISRLKPSVIFMVSPWNALKQVKSFFKSMRGNSPEPPVVIVSDAEEPDEMFEIIKLGAADFIIPPLTPAGILPRLWRLIEQSRWGEALGQRLKEKLGGVKTLIGASPAFIAAVGKIPIVAQCDASILISGETGTGKEVCARTIHQLSTRADRDFIPVNCGAIPVELVENELFGHERGAFTNAASSQAGLIEAADGGTLFLDEIDSLPLLAQVKLLRFLQEKEYRPLGSNKTRQANVRIITATNVNVEKAVRDGILRQDLYYRLNMIPIVLPPLRERSEDIPLLAANFLARYAIEFKKPVNGFSPDALQILALHDWPGNVRELEHVVGRAVAMAENSIIRSCDIVITNGADSSRRGSFQEIKAQMVEQFERTYLQSLLTAHQGNITRAAVAAQKNRRAFFQLLRKHGIDASNFKAGE
jgi:DNA-binding NtrC family response regulator